MKSRLLSAGLLAFGLITIGCTSPREQARADSVRVLVAQQGQLMQRLTAQRDSVSRVLGDADAFIGKIDSSISRVKGLASSSRATRGSEGPLEDQVRQRKAMLHRVDALVKRARETAREWRIIESIVAESVLGSP